MLIFIVGCQPVKTQREKELDFATKVYQCMHYCNAVYSFEDCKEGCFSKKEGD